MKYITLFVFLLFHYLSISQTSSRCDELIELTSDKFTKKEYYSSKNYIISENARILWLQSDDKNVHTILIQLIGYKGCIDEGNSLYFLFDDNTTYETGNNADFRCNGSTSLRFGGLYGKRKALKQFTQKKVKSIRVWGMKNFQDIEFDNEASQDFFDTINCLIALKEK